MNSDGQVIIDSKIDSSGMEAGAKEIVAAIQELTSIIKEFVASFSNSFEKAASATSAVVEKVDEVTESMSSATEEAESLQAAMDKITITGLYPEEDELTPEIENLETLADHVDEVIQKSEELEDAVSDAMQEVATETEQAVKGPGLLQMSIQMLVQSFKDIPLIARAGFDALKNSMAEAESSTATLQDEIDRYTDALYYAERAGYGLGDAPYDEAYKGLYLARKNAEEYRKKLVGADEAQKEVTKSSDKMNKSLKSTNKTTIPLTKSIFKLGNMFKLMLVRMAMRTVISGAKEGFENLAQYSDNTNVAISSLLSAMTQLKNAFATAFSPVLEVVSPALTKFIGLLAEATTWVAQLFAALTGKDTFVKAVKVQEDYAESLKDTAKEAKKAIAPFDDLVQLTSAKKEDTSISDMFTTEEVTNEVKAQADAIKELFDSLFDPLKNAWDKYGSTVVDSIKNAFSSLKDLVAAVGSSFLKAWNDLGYGERITGNLLQAFANLADTVAILADRFREAWEAGGLGDSIMRHLLDIVETFSEKILRATEIIKTWAATLDFTPILTAFDNLLQAINPLVDTIGDALLWLLEYVLLPLASWTIQDAIPAFFNLLAAALRAINAVLVALQPLWQWFWDTVLQPIASFAGDVFIAFLESLTAGLTNFSKWCAENQGIIQNAAIIIGSFFAAFAIVSIISGIASVVGALITFVSGIGAAITAAGGLVAAITALLGPFGLAVVAIGAVIAAIALLVYNWDFVTEAFQQGAGKITGAFQNIANTLSTLANLIADAWNTIKTSTDGVWSSIPNIIIMAMDLVVDKIANAINNIGNAFQLLAQFVKSPFDAIKQYIEAFVNSIIQMVDRIIKAIKSIAEAAASLTGGGGGSGSTGYSAASASTYSIPANMYSALTYEMPHLATGTVIPPRSGEFAAILGDNKRDYEVVSPVETMKQAFKDVITEMGGLNNNQTIEATMTIDGNRFGRLVAKFGNQENQRIGVRMVTEG